MDDGWFGARNNDRAGLGDWTVNPQKFPQGLKGLIDHVNGLGMDFGLWVEPEMVNAEQRPVPRPSRLGDQLSRIARAANCAIS